MSSPHPAFSRLRVTAATLLASAAFSLAQEKLADVTRQPDAYNTWKLALTPGVATDSATGRFGTPPCEILI